MTAATVPPPAKPAPSRLLTAEEFVRLPETRGLELVRGRIVELPMPGFLHGLVCAEIAARLHVFARQNDLGRVLSNDSHLQVPVEDGSGVDTVRGMDVAFFSWERVPRDERPTGLPPNAPELIVEVRSPSDRPGAVLRKVGEYLARGVDVVAVLNPERRSAFVYTQSDDEPAPLGEDEMFVPGEFLPGFSVRVGDFFDI